MIAVQVMGNDAAIGMAASQGNFELNVFMPLLAYNFLQSVRLLADGIRSFDVRCVSGIKANRAKMEDNLHRSLMLVTALNPHIGYENAARVAKKAHAEGITLKEACISLGYLDAAQFDAVFQIAKRDAGLLERDALGVGFFGHASGVLIADMRLESP